MACVQKKSRLTLADQELILQTLPRAAHLTKKLLARTGLRLDSNEIESATYLALCDAALSFDASRGVSFLTYAWYFIQGEVRQALTFRYGGKRPPTISLSWSQAESDEAENIDIPVPGQQERIEIWDMLRSAFSHLSPVALQVVLLVEILGFTIVAAAEELGYSRPYLNTVHSQAIASLRQQLSGMEM